MAKHVDIARSPSGFPDTGFGSQGRAEVSNQQQLSTTANAVVSSSDDTLLAAWADVREANARIGIAQFSATGTMDPGFGAEGMAVGAFRPPYRSALQGLIKMPDGRCLIYGGYLIPAAPAPYLVPALLCFTDSGTVDSQFAEQGVFSVGEPQENERYTVTGACVLPSGGILLVYGKTTGIISKTYITKLTVNGLLDLDFAEQGTREFQHAGKATLPGGVISLSNGHFVVFSGFLNEYSFMACFDENGTLVPTFGEEGVVALQYDDKSYVQISVADTGKGLVSVGWATLGENTYRGMMTGLDYSGHVNCQFNGGEPVIITHAFAEDGNALCHQITVQKDGALAICGYRPLSSATPKGFIGRYLPDGTPDHEFGFEGQADLGGFVISASQVGIVELPAENRLVIAGAVNGQGCLAGWVS